jgi:uracil-DNA glycosylase
MSTFAQKVIQFNNNLDFKGNLPDGIRIMNPFRENPSINSITKRFYTKFYNDDSQRRIILGINPGRLGAGATGIPFTDTKRLAEKCNIHIDTFTTHEPSSVFIYEMIEQYGGVEQFYHDYYINSTCPLGFLKKNNRGNWVNCNYYDYEELYEAMEKFIISSLKKQISFGVDTDICFSLGKKNAKFLERINEKEHLFNQIVPLAHPRYIVQYKSREKESFISDYLAKLSS